MSGAAPPRGLPCPGCGSGLEPLDEGPDDLPRLICPECGATYRARRRGAAASAAPLIERTPWADPPPGGFGLVTRGLALRGVEWAFRVGSQVGSIAMLGLGGFVPVLDGWMRDEVVSWAGAVEVLGGVTVVTETTDPDADLGPAIARGDAPLLFDSVDEVARRVGARPPSQVRLTYLPCCGVVAWGGGRTHQRSRALVIGLPLLHVLTLGELRAVLAHELAHLARGDATRAADSTRFAQGLSRALEQAEAGPAIRRRSPLRLWTRLCERAATRLLEPLARGQEVRADRAAASVAGGAVAASALVKVALLQPLFREVLDHFDPERADLPNLYAFFRAFWDRLPPEALAAMRLRLISDKSASVDPAHPPLPDRVSVLQSYPDRPDGGADRVPASLAMGDLEAFEQMLHNRLFGLPAVEPSVFHRNRC